MAQAQPYRTAGEPLDRFFAIKARSLVDRAHQLEQLTPHAVGLRASDMPYAPKGEHFAAANRRLKAIDRDVKLRMAELAKLDASASTDDRLLTMAMVERELDRARRAFGMFFEVFAQRGTAFARSLAAHDAIARDCYAVVERAAPRIFPGPLVPPFTYLEHGYSPATMRRGVTLSRLLGESNPFPLIRIPYDRDRPWQAVFLHEVAHNLQADLGLWVENRTAVLQRLAEARLAPLSVSIFGRWHKEIFADLAALLLGGPAAAFGLAEFLAHPADKVMTYRPGGPHPTGYLRVLILAEMLRRMGFEPYGRTLGRIWTRLYDPRRGHRLPRILVAEARRAIPAVVDEIAFQTRRALAERALASIIPFTREDQAAIRRGGLRLAQGRAPADLPPRFLVSAARYAIEAGLHPRTLHELLLSRLAPAHPQASSVITLKVA
ncbi:MAG: hypothetical protein M5U07_25025 [Xanthobacteraceae bacterium]|nr:hypothetical protein [Xanthobacteraceae bacterium]PWB60098.1 MAG: hypothetical protein C3F17_15320 [Bradyrhizobiaceae bacterium]